MQAKEELLEQLGETYGYVSAFAEKRLTVLKLSAAEKSASIVSSLILLFVIIIMVSAVSLFALLALAFFFSAKLDSYVQGFGLVSLLLLAILVFIILLRKTLIVNPAVKSVIASFFPPEETANAPEPHE